MSRHALNETTDDAADATAAPTTRRSGAPGAVRALRALSTLAVLSIVVQGATAGAYLSGNRAANAFHYAGAFAVHGLTALTLVAAVLVARRHGGPWWPTVLAAVVVAVGFVQALLGDLVLRGDYGLLAVHVPLAMLLLVGAAWLAAWSFARARA